MISMTSVEAQNNFGKLLDAAQREPVVVTRRGRAAAFIVSPADMDELMANRDQRSKAVAAFKAFFAESDKHLTAAARQLSEEDIARLVRASR